MTKSPPEWNYKDECEYEEFIHHAAIWMFMTIAALIIIGVGVLILIW